MLFLTILCFSIIGEFACLPKNKFFLVEREESQQMQETGDYEDMSTEPGDQNTQLRYYRRVFRNITHFLSCVFLGHLNFGGKVFKAQV